MFSQVADMPILLFSVLLSRFRFAPLRPEQITSRLQEVMDAER
jgi:hypothetical protein